jgi:hypothetical protein
MLEFIQEAREIDSDPWVILGKPANPGEKLNIRISYKEYSTEDSRIIYGRGTNLYYVASRESWFPSLGAYDDRTLIEIRARSPKNLKFVASGIQTAYDVTADGQRFLMAAGPKNSAAFPIPVVVNRLEQLKKQSQSKKRHRFQGFSKIQWN